MEKTAFSTCLPILNPSFKGYSRYLFWSLALLAATLGLLYVFFGAPVLAAGLHYQVFAEDLEEISALAFDRNGDLYATLEKRHGQGQLVLIQGGLTHTLLDNLDKPDGILLHGNTLYITNEAGSHALIAYESGTLRYLDGASSAEGIASAGPDKILIVEDKKQDGRLLRIDPVTAEIEVLLVGLKDAEGACQSPDGDVYYVEKTSDRLSRYTGGRVTTAATGLTNPAFLNCLADGSILITEDRTNFGRLLRYRQGTIDILATHLRSPQSVIMGADGAYYLAEQRKNRILRLYAS
ncbi:MAG: hypothetical protein DRQ45_04830 [Gammaproteobacteria bacterium]|nr:MAG: hypothetical protein DRQ45_04830 [Gammaproteobacteria bacterium]